MQKEVWVIRAKSILGMTDQKVAKASWPLEELNYLYGKLIDVFPKAKEKNLKKEWVQLFLAIDNQNPYLPKELLPASWLEDECKKLLHKTGEAGLLKAIFSKITPNPNQQQQNQ